MRENQRSISDWANSTFGHIRVLNVAIQRMLHEVDELKEIDIHNDPNAIENIANEGADIYITLVRIFDTIGYDLQSCVDHKMMINRSRIWISHGDGTGRHVKQ